MTRRKSLFSRAKQIYGSEGLGSLLRRGLAFVLSLIFKYQTYYLYKDPLQGLRLPNEADVLPRVHDFAPKVVTTNQEADELEAEGFEFRSQVLNAREKLDKGAMAFCIFVGQELANIGWIALTQEAMDSLGELPCRVDFSDYEAYGGGMWTNPKFRKRGIHLYGMFKRLEFLQSKGIKAEHSVVAKDNVAPQKSNALGGMLPFPGPYAEGRYLRILWWRSWKERPLTHANDMSQT